MTKAECYFEGFLKANNAIVDPLTEAAVAGISVYINQLMTS